MELTAGLAITYFTLELQLICLLRVLIAALMGGLVGLERSRRQKKAGIRTHIIVAMGSALMMIVSKYGFFDVLSNPSIDLDASRIASNVITGIGFLGAGVIFVRRGSIRGLTTAAGIWTTAGIGLAIGAGMYLLGVLATLLMIVMQLIFHGPLQRLEGNLAERVTVVLCDAPGAITGFLARLRECGADATVLGIEKNEQGILLRLEVTGMKLPGGDELVAFYESDPHVKAIKL